MGVRIYYPNKDNTLMSSSTAPPKNIPGGFFSGSVYANAGASQVLKLGKTIDTTMSASTGLRVGQDTSDGDGFPINLNRILINFPLGDISSSLKANTDNPPADGGLFGADARYYLKMYNASSPVQAAKSFSTNIHLVISKSWNEGTGLDLDTYKHIGYSNWKNPNSTASWHTSGLGSGSAVETNSPDRFADYLNYFSGSNKVITASFDTGAEDMNVDITALVQPLLSGTGKQALPNQGFLVKLGRSEEKNSKDYIEKYFFSSDTHTIYSPRLIVKYDDFKGDDRNYVLTDTPNRFYLNYSKKGQLADIEGITNGPTSTNKNQSSFLTCSIYSGNLSGTLPTGSALIVYKQGAYLGQQQNLTCSRFQKGVYRTPFFQMSKSFLSGSGSGKFFDIWYNTTNTNANFAITRSFTLLEDDTYASFTSLSPEELTTAMPGLQSVYRKDYDKNVRFDVVVRKRGRSLDDPNREKIFTIYTGSYEIIDHESKDKIIEFDDTYTRLSYDENGNYFSLNMDSFDKNRTYEIHFKYKVEGNIFTDTSDHKFRII